MRAAGWRGGRDVRVDTVPDPTIQEPTDAVIRMTTSGSCGSGAINVLFQLFQP